MTKLIAGFAYQPQAGVVLLERIETFEQLDVSEVSALTSLRTSDAAHLFYGTLKGRI